MNSTRTGSIIGILFWIVIVGLCAAETLWPGDAPWIADEPLLMAKASIDNQTPASYLGISLPFTVATKGIASARGIIYGPLPLWIYQLGLAFSHNLERLIAIRAFCLTFVIALSMVWLARSLDLNPWMAAVILLSPWIWIYSRQLWDNSFCIPLCALLLAAYAGFLKTRRGWMLLLAAFCAVAMLLIHLMSLAIVVPFFAQLVFVQWRFIGKYRLAVGAVCIAAIVVPLPYWMYLMEHVTSAKKPDGSPLASALFPLFGAHHLTATGIGPFLAAPGNWFDSLGETLGPIVANAAAITLFIYIACWIGMGLSIPRAINALKKGANADVSSHIALLALCTWLMQTIIDAIERASGLEHYFNATWIIYALFAWWAIQAIPSRAFHGVVVAILSAALATVTITLILFIHTHAGTRTESYGTTLASQLAVERQMENYSADSPVMYQYPLWKRFPVAPIVLRTLYDKTEGTNLPARKLVVKYVSASGPDSRIELFELPADSTEPFEDDNQP